MASTRAYLNEQYVVHLVLAPWRVRAVGESIGCVIVKSSQEFEGINRNMFRLDSQFMIQLADSRMLYSWHTSVC